MNKKIRVIARGSRLSRLQVEEVFKNFPELAYEIKYLESYGDKNQQISLLNGEAPADIFTRELDDAIRQGDADIAIHSAKDLPYPLPEDLEVIALFPAFDTTDSLVSRNHKKLAELPAGSIIGTSSPLRKKGLNELRPDLTIKGIRGCIEERVQQVKDGKYDAAIVATCALKRLGMEDEITEVLPFPTHPLQGFLAVTAKKGSQDLKQAFASKSILDKQGSVFLVGFGPGDPDLLTIKAAKAIDAADIIFYDDLIDDSYLADKKAEKIYVGKRAGYHHKEQADINRLLLEAAREGKNVVRLKGGDPMIFAHGSEEIEYLESNLIKVNVIPGITTASALAASQKISLTHRDFSSSVALVSGHTPQPVTPDAETLVYYMGAKQLQTIATQLIDKEGWAFNTPVLLTYNVSRPDEQTFETTLWNLRNGEMQNLPTPLIALIGYVAGLKHHQASDIKPTLYTGTLPAIEKRKADYTYTPLIEISYHPSYFTKILEDNYCEHYDGKSFTEYCEWDESQALYYIFTSQYGVQATLDYYDLILNEQEEHVFISIGDTTTEALHKAGVKDVIQVEQDYRYGVIEWFKKEKERLDAARPQYEHSFELFEKMDLDNYDHELADFVYRYENRLVFYPHSSLSPEDIPLALQELGFNVLSAVVYNNELPKNPRRVNLNHFKRIVFTSPSTIDNFIKLYGKLPENTEFITRGPITQAHLEEVLNKYYKTDIDMKRVRELRKDQATRDKYADVSLSAADFIYPYFVVEGENQKEEISTMPGIYRFSIDTLLKDIEEIKNLGINKVLLFGVIPDEQKDERGSAAYADAALIARAVKAIKAEFGKDIIVFTDVCLCEYTSHGHCGLLHHHDVDNDSTLPLLAEEAYVHAKAGADFVAPSAMMDGQVEAIKNRLREGGLDKQCKVLAYSAKYASAFYGPFRDAADSAPSFGDRKSYQMDFRTHDQGLDEIAADIEEGADWTMVKPAMPYLDMIARGVEKFPNIPMVAYQVSGEYSMLKAAAKLGYLDESRVAFESLIAIKRAGAQYIITYYAKEIIEKAEEWNIKIG